MFCRVNTESFKIYRYFPFKILLLINELKLGHTICILRAHVKEPKVKILSHVLCVLFITYKKLNSTHTFQQKKNTLFDLLTYALRHKLAFPLKIIGLNICS